MKWTYKDQEITPEEVPEGAIGFVYRITQKSKNNYEELLNGEQDGDKIYIGKKTLTNTIKKKVGVREQAKQLLDTGDKRKVKKVVRQSKESNWVDYESSSAQLKKEIKETPELFSKQILYWCYSKKELTYREAQAQFVYNVLEANSYNDNILGKFFRKDLNKPSKIE